jgi:predicted RNase H-like HicB family nuclease
MTTLRYLVVIEESATGYGAYAPDVPGCIATGATREEVVERFQEALAFHLESLIEDGDDVPGAISTATEVSVSFPAATARA